MGELTLAGSETGFATTKLQDLLGWARKYSLFNYPFVTACCGMEFMAVSSPRYDFARFGAEAPRFSPRQSDLLWVVGTISQRQQHFDEERTAADAASGRKHRDYRLWQAHWASERVLQKKSVPDPSDSHVLFPLGTARD